MLKYLLPLMLLSTSPISAQPVTKYTTLDPAQCVQKSQTVLQCRSFLPIWIEKASRSTIMVGVGNSARLGTWGDYREKEWKLEWRGAYDGTRFEPYALIMRMVNLRNNDPTLVVFRIFHDRTACLIGEAPTNEQARGVADSDLECLPDSE